MEADDTSSSTKTAGGRGGDEAAFVIYSAEQQRTRDAERKAKEEAEKAEVCLPC